MRKTVLFLALALPGVALSQAWSDYAPAAPSFPCQDGWMGCVQGGERLHPQLQRDSQGKPTPADMRLGWFDLQPTTNFTPFAGFSAYTGQAPATIGAASSGTDGVAGADPEADPTDGVPAGDGSGDGVADAAQVDPEVLAAQRAAEEQRRMEATERRLQAEAAEEAERARREEEMRRREADARAKTAARALEDAKKAQNDAERARLQREAAAAEEARRAAEQAAQEAENLRRERERQEAERRAAAEKAAQEARRAEEERQRVEAERRAAAEAERRAEDERRAKAAADAEREAQAAAEAARRQAEAEAAQRAAEAERQAEAARRAAQAAQDEAERQRLEKEAREKEQARLAAEAQAKREAEAAAQRAADEARQRAAAEQERIAAERAAAEKAERDRAEAEAEAARKAEAAAAAADPGSCTDLQQLETKAVLGRLDAGTIACLNTNLEAATRQTEKGKISRLLMSNAFAAGKTGEWEQMMKRHLEQFDQSDPDLCYKYALHLAKKGPGSAYGAIKWADIALENRSVWTGSTYTQRVYSLYKVRTVSAQKIWLDLENKHTQNPTDESNEKVKDARNRTKVYAREWYEYAKVAGKDTADALDMCQSAAGTKKYCEAG